METAARMTPEQTADYFLAEKTKLIDSGIRYDSDNDMYIIIERLAPVGYTGQVTIEWELPQYRQFFREDMPGCMHEGYELDDLPYDSMERRAVYCTVPGYELE